MVTIKDLKEQNIAASTINKLLGANAYCASVRIRVPNGEDIDGETVYDTRVARNSNQLKSYLNQPGAEIVT